MHWLDNLITSELVRWGYLAVVLALFAENMGVPLPGESVLVFASFVAHKTTGLRIYWIIPIGIATAIMGDNLGFFLGRKLGSTLLRWSKKIFRVSEEDVRIARDLIRRRGWFTVFIARYIFGLRTITGPVAGMLGMKWRSFLSANAMGAATWVSAICLAGYLFASFFRTLMDYFEKAGWAFAAGLFALGYFLWRRYKKDYDRRHSHAG